VACFGDSITHGPYPKLLGQLLPIEVINAGIGGNTTRNGLARIQKDVLDHRPDVVVVLFGTNDSRLDAPAVHVPIPKYEANLTEIIQRCRQINAKVVLGTPPPINPGPYFTRHDKAKFDAAGGLPKVIGDYCAAVERVAKAQNVPLIAFHKRLADDATFLSKDGVHPSPAGNERLAKLVAQVIAPLVNLPAPK
jgi:lysophospholipase L1-like esterase